MKAKLLIPLLVLLAACNTTDKPMTDEQKNAVKEEGSVVVNEFFDAMKNSNLEKLLTMVENTPDFTYITGGEITDIMKCSRRWPNSICPTLRGRLSSPNLKST